MATDFAQHARRAIEKVGALHEIVPASGGPALSIYGWFSSAGLIVLDGTMPGVSSAQPSFCAMADDLAEVAIGDKLTHAGVAYRIATKSEPEQPSGHITMRLERQE